MTSMPRSLPKSLPNILTIARLLAAPAFALVFALMPRPLADWVALGLFIVAALTDFLDGWLARRMGATSALGRMLDPIADKAMVIIALATLVGLSGLNPLVMIPATAILFREVLISGLREFLGAESGKLSVTRLAKWKTTVQMVAIPVLMLAAIWQYDYLLIYNQIGLQGEYEVLTGVVEDEFGLIPTVQRFQAAQWLGLGLIWLAAALTLWTGLDYFRKALPVIAAKGD